MAKCKDCIHEEICDMPIITDGRKNASNCNKFKNKADFVEVRHGEWEDLYKGKYDNPLYTCSECYCRALRTNEKDVLGHIKCRQELSPYCPHCGAKMDGKNDNDLEG